MIDVLCKQGKRNEAIAIADKQSHDKEHQIECYKRCLEGDKREIQLLQYASDKAHEFLRALYSCKTEEAFDTAMDFLKLLYPIPNDGYYDSLINLLNFKADKYIKEQSYDKAMDIYQECQKVAVDLEEYVRNHPENEPWYTSPMFKKCMGSKEIYHDLNPHEMVYVFLTAPKNKALFSREDYKALCDTLEEQIKAYAPFNQ